MELDDRNHKELKTKKRLSIFAKELLTNWQLYAFLLPVLTYFIIFHYIPMYGVQIAFRNFNATDGFWGSEFVGFTHFKRFFSSYYFWRLIKNTLLLSLFHLLFFPLLFFFDLSYNIFIYS